MHPLPPPIAAVADALRDLRAPWAIAGGWAIDLALGRTTRAHADVDLAVFRDEQAALPGALPGWRFDVAMHGQLVPWRSGERLALPVHEVHAHPPADAARPPSSSCSTSGMARIGCTGATLASACRSSGR